MSHENNGIGKHERIPIALPANSNFTTKPKSAKPYLGNAKRSTLTKIKQTVQKSTDCKAEHIPMEKN